MSSEQVRIPLSLHGGENEPTNLRSVMGIRVLRDLRRMITLAHYQQAEGVQLMSGLRAARGSGVRSIAADRQRRFAVLLFMRDDRDPAGVSSGFFSKRSNRTKS